MVLENPDWIERHPIIGKGVGGALLLFVGMAIGSGWANTDKIGQVWHDANRDKVTAIQAVQATIPKATPSKTEKATTEPANCIPHPEPKPTE